MNNEISASSILGLFRTTKEERQSFADSLLQDLENGVKSALDVHLQLKRMGDIIDRITADKNYRDYLNTEAIHRGRTFEMHNAKFTIREMGGKWDYTQTEDTELHELEYAKLLIETQIKKRQEFLKNIPDGGILDPETGAMIYRAAKPATTTTVAVTLK